MKPPVPDSGVSLEYLLWSQGAADEAAIRNEGLSTEARGLRDALEAFARGHQDLRAGELAAILARIYCRHELPLRQRIALAWKIVW